MNVLEYIKDHITYLDGGFGTQLQKYGIQGGELPERWNVSHPDIITEIHKSYYDAGSNIVSANTFGANSLKYDDEELEAVIRAAIDNVRRARELSETPQEKFIALDIGPLGKLLRPIGTLDFEDAVAIYSKTIRIGAEYGVDLILIETMTDSFDTKAALLAAKETCDLPVFVSNAYEESGKLMTGADPASMITLLEGMGADAIGVNCSLGPKHLNGIVKEYLEKASVPVLVKPNAGLPRTENGVVIYDVLPEEFSDDLLEFAKDGVRLMGGCCGTTPDFIRATVEKTGPLEPVPVTVKDSLSVSSPTHAVALDGSDTIGDMMDEDEEEILDAVEDGDVDTLIDEGFDLKDDGVDIIALPEINDDGFMNETVYEIQAVINLPLVIISSNLDALEVGLRHYNGRPLYIYKGEDVDAAEAIAKKYGAISC